MSKEILFKAANAAIAYLDKSQNLPVGVGQSWDELLDKVDKNLPQDGEPPDIAIEKLIAATEQALVTSTHARYFGFVIGGATPTSIAADWLTTSWDQNAQVYQSSPAASIIESVVAEWLLDILHLPKDAGVGFVTGGQMANFTALTVARNTVLQQQGWDIDEHGLQGAPPINLVCADCCHGTIHSALRLMGLGSRHVKPVATDAQGRMLPKQLESVLAQCQGPVILCVQAGNVNTGSFDPFTDIIPIAKQHGAWVHVDGAFGLWACASPNLAPLVADIDMADSWAVDAHKWLNVPYDSGIIIMRNVAAHTNLKTNRCAYAGPVDAQLRDGSQWVPENSRRARAFVLYAVLRNLGRTGVTNLIDNACNMAQTFASLLAQIPGARIMNDVVLNQVLCRLEPDTVSDIDAFNVRIAQNIQKSGICWLGTTRWQDQTALRISISNYQTSQDDVQTAVQCIHDAYHSILNS